VQVGLRYASQIVTIEVDETTLRVYDHREHLIKHVPRTSRKEVTRHKAYAGPAFQAVCRTIAAGHDRLITTLPEPCTGRSHLLQRGQHLEPGAHRQGQQSFLSSVTQYLRLRGTTMTKAMTAIGGTPTWTGTIGPYPFTDTENTVEIRVVATGKNSTQQSACVGTVFITNCEPG